MNAKVYFDLKNKKDIDKTTNYRKLAWMILSSFVEFVAGLKSEVIDGNFGNRFFAGEEKRAYINIIYDDIIMMFGIFVVKKSC